jgi:TRAP-type C4-dicarboxylate transport system permease small subunit
MLLKQLIKYLEYLSGFLLAVMMTSIIVQVVLRGIFDVGLGWTEELARYTMIWLTYIGAIVSLRRGSHILIDLLVRRFSIRWQRYIALVTHLLTLFFLFFLFKAGIRLNSSPIIRNQRTPGMQIPTTVLYSVIPVCSMIMIIFVLVIIVELIIEIRNKINSQKDATR